MIAPPPEFSAELESALERHGIKPRAVSLVSPLKERKGRRWAYRVEGDDGRVVKARQFEDDGAARRAFELLADIEDAFAPALARYGTVLIEEWIEGVALADLDWRARVEEAGALLGRLHAKPLASGEPSVRTEEWRDGARCDLDLLAGAGKLEAREIALLEAALARLDPAVAHAARVHMDFCADNMLVDRSGRLRVIDNELIGVGPIDLDLARTFNLWPMPDDAWLSFREGYDATAPAVPAATEFWRMVATLIDARVFLHRSPTRLATALARLHRFIAAKGSPER